jgi:hypothetical protein
VKKLQKVLGIRQDGHAGETACARASDVPDAPHHQPLRIIAVISATALWIYREGGEDTRNANERQNNEAETRADQDALDYDACRDAGRCGASGPANVSGLHQVVETDLLGTRGLTDGDQRRIDRTLVRLCAGRAYSAKECAQHDLPAAPVP